MVSIRAPPPPSISLSLLPPDTHTSLFKLKIKENKLHYCMFNNFQHLPAGIFVALTPAISHNIYNICSLSSLKNAWQTTCWIQTPCGSCGNVQENTKENIFKFHSHDVSQKNCHPGIFSRDPGFKIIAVTDIKGSHINQYMNKAMGRWGSCI